MGFDGGILHLNVMKPFQLTYLDWKSREKKQGCEHLCFAYKNMRGPILPKHVNELEERCSTLTDSTGMYVPDATSDREMVMRTSKRTITENSMGSNKRRKEDIPLQEIPPLHEQKDSYTENMCEKIDNMVTSIDNFYCTINNISNLM